MIVRKKTFLLLAAMLFMHGHSWALSLGPALQMVQHVKPGEPVDLKAKAGIVYTVTNSSEKDSAFALVCMKPVEGGVLSWEAGYDEIPDASWCKLEKEEFVVPAKSKVEVGLTISIPDKPEYYNCKWIVAVVLKAGKAAGIGVGLSVAARVQIETARSEDPNTGAAASLAALPCVVTIEGKPGSAFDRSVTLKNNTKQPLELAAMRLEDCYPIGESRYPRYTSSGYRALEKDSWLKEKEMKFSLKPDEKHEFKLKGEIPATAKPGDKWEELVFISTPLPAAEDKTAKRPVQTFFRVLYQVVAEGK